MNLKLLLVVICCVIYAVNADRPIKRSDASVANTVKVTTKLANNSKSIAKRGIFSLGHRHHHHATFSLVPASSLFAHHHKTLIKPAVAVPAIPAAVPTFVHRPAFVPVHHHHTPTVVQTPTVIHHQQTPTIIHHQQTPNVIHHQHTPNVIHHQHTPTVVQSAFPVPVVPSLPPVAPPTIFKRPASVIPFTIVPGGASVTSYAVNFPRYPFIQRTPHLLPLPKPIIPAAAPVGPTILPFAPLPPPQFLPAPVPTKPIIPVAIPFPGIHKPKIPVIIDNKPIFQNEFYPVNAVNPQFVPIPVPSHPTDSGTNIQPIQSTISTITVTPSQTSTTILPSTPQTVNMWRPIPNLTYTPPPTVPTMTTAIPINKQREYLPPSPTPELISSTNYNQLLSGNTNANQPTQNQLQFAQQLQHQFLQQQQQQFEQQQWQQLQHLNLQNQQQQQQHQQQDYQPETFNLNYDAPSNNGHYNGPSSYEVPQY